MRANLLGGLATGLCLSCLPGCNTAAGRYFSSRARDLGDVFDLDLGIGPGLGAKVEITHLLVPSFGIAETAEIQKRARTWEKFPGFGFASLGVFGIEGNNPHEFNLFCLGINIQPILEGTEGTLMNPPLEFGPKLYLGYLSAGLYFNLAEFVDLVVGLAGADPWQDDEPAPSDIPGPAESTQGSEERSQPQDKAPAHS